MPELKELAQKFAERFGSLDNFSVEKITDEACAQYTDLIEGDLEADHLRRIWQFYCADRKDKKQDFTPDSLARLVSALTQSETEEWVYDMCAGSGALTIQKWVHNKKAKFVCEELDSGVIPYLLFNLKIRNIAGFVINGNVLTGKREAVYKLSSGSRFSHIERVNPEEFEYPEFQTGIGNPPFNIKGSTTSDTALFDSTQEVYSPVELKNMNYVFVFKMIERVKGKSAVILPAGVLSSADEKRAREYLLKNNRVASVVLNPPSMFESTGTQTAVLVFDTHAEFVSFVNGIAVCQQEERRQCGEKHTANRVYVKTFNVYYSKGIERIIDAIKNRECADGFSQSVLSDAIKDSDLRIASHIKQKEEAIKHRPFEDIVKDLIHIVNRKNAFKLHINETWARQYGMLHTYELMKQSNENLESTNKMIKKVLKLGLEIPKENWIGLTKSKEWVLENYDKEYVSPIIVHAMLQWHTMVESLNTEEARLLAEFRDALLPELMSGRIDVSSIDIDEGEVA